MARKAHRRAKGRDSFKRRAPTRTPRSRILIVTEGAKTEPGYFRHLIRELRLTATEVKIAHEGGNAPISVVRHAQKILRQDPDFDQIYLVFDRDMADSYDAALAEIAAMQGIKHNRGKVIAAIVSVPCFEIWYLMHVTPARKPYGGNAPGQDLLRDLTAANPCFAGYRKNSDPTFFEALSPLRGMALHHAAAALGAARAEDHREFHENPSTRVHELVSALVQNSDDQ